jgi:hypothetical protein
MIMKRFHWLLALMAALLLSAAPVLADDGFYVIAGGGKAGTQINSVPYTINSPGLYCLAKNLTYTATTDNAITVNASDVTLDLNGFCLTGPGKTSGSHNEGISINAGLTNVEIRNGSVKSFGYYGIQAASCTGIRVIGLRVSDNGAAGIWMAGFDHLVVGCSAFNNGSFGATIANGMLKGNHVYDNGGQGLNAGDGSTISGNVSRSNVGAGIYASSGNSVLDNTVMGNGQQGIYTTHGCTVTRNTSRGNTGTGIATGDNCLITNNTTQGLTFGSGSTSLNNLVY